MKIKEIYEKSMTPIGKQNFKKRVIYVKRISTEFILGPVFEAPNELNGVYFAKTECIWLKLSVFG